MHTFLIFLLSNSLFTFLFNLHVNNLNILIKFGHTVNYTNCAKKKSKKRKKVKKPHLKRNIKMPRDFNNDRSKTIQ